MTFVATIRVELDTNQKWLATKVAREAADMLFEDGVVSAVAVDVAEGTLPDSDEEAA